MKTYNLHIILILFLTGFSFYSCKDLDEININPNGIDPAKTNPKFLLGTVITETGTRVLGLGFGDIAGVMQHTQKDGWASGHNSYDWTTSQNWDDYYGNLRNAEEMRQKAHNMGLEFYEGAALVFKAYNFGIIADIWGDAPFSDALKGEEGVAKPVYDSQRDIYLGILAYLEEANTLLSKGQSQYTVDNTLDVLFGGSVIKWRKFANSLALRYYLRILDKEPSIAEAGIAKIINNPDKYPLTLDHADDAAFAYVGSSGSDSWPCNTKYNADETNWRRLKMCSTLVELLRDLKDPRLPVWADKIATPLVIDPSKPADFDKIIDGERVIGTGVAKTYEDNYKVPLNLNKDYIGLPPAWHANAQSYNLNPNLAQAPINPHASHISSMYKNATGDLLKTRMLSASEMYFILAELAWRGLPSIGTAEENFYAGIKASFDTWGVGDSYADYVARVTYDNTLEQIMWQKWIASWSAATEAWFDWRRTGLPALKPGTVVKRNAIPIRFYYGLNELDYNGDNVDVAIQNLDATNYNLEDGKNSAWSKMWLLKDTGKPW